MVDAGKEAYPGRTHGIVVWEEELETEDAAYITISILYYAVHWKSIFVPS